MSGMAGISIIISIAEFLYMSTHMGVKGYKRRKILNKEKNLLWTQDKIWNPYENPDYQQKLREHNIENGSLSRRRINSRSTSGYQTPTRRERPFSPPKNNQHETSVLIEHPRSKGPTLPP
ncbi:Oidioi.mRNA.OKI2018_I69.PAR.g12862.t1.cds [Oikopleura dioica]|uniref:Oidioi.mRNA.OKI2018_I69.PAR.g12862.t1.cds n=1 Tax=Oikopleura dioica TaxID=34765 RepID=A0ABN7S212_OIKDI|nr:Oidioi.mRNA.OKI2018_I69.PAR.g12862.t1.cds [Oikopleura dioica]